MIYVLLFGRIGNNLSQIAAAASLAARVGQAWKAVISDYYCPSPDNCTLAAYIAPYRNTILRNVEFEDQLPQNLRIIGEDTDLRQVSIKSDESVLLNGWYMDYNFYNPDIIKKLFNIDDSTKNYINNNYPALQHGEWCSVVVRRGDYLQLKKDYAICGKNYYKRAIQIVQKRNTECHFLIISDDIEWCKKNIIMPNVTYVEDEPPIIDLYLASYCQHHIISNSSFAWWGCYLQNHSGTSIVICPKPWYGIGQWRKEKKIQSQMSKEWIRISNISTDYLVGIKEYIKYSIRKYL